MTMYPDFIKDAEAESMKRALNTFKWAWEVEKIHQALSKALTSLEAQQPVQEVEYYECPTWDSPTRDPLKVRARFVKPWEKNSSESAKSI